MDNLTHSIIGLIAGESAAAIDAPAGEGVHGLGADARRRLYAAIGIVGGNLPDIDLLVSGAGAFSVRARYTGHTSRTTLGESVKQG